ncbi:MULTISPECIES: PAS domain-containing protein [unclassified Brevundimonas]|uniref:PAS domain-containing protein n=1 Tax=unclassified Brevundimonas TaxID=2622653 RepID=UPI0025C5E5DC|nr:MULTISPECIES: PAS domain-containing protein [unclassified Brevundimonas]
MKSLLAGGGKVSPAPTQFIETAPWPLAKIDREGVVVSTNPAWAADSRLADIRLITGDDIRLDDARWLRPSVTKIGEADHDVRVCSLADVTDLVSQGGKSQPDYYRRMLDVFQDCVKVIDPSGRLLYLNSAGREVLGVEDGQALGMRWVDLIPPAAVPKVEQVLEQVLAGETAQFSNHAQFPDGEAQTWDHILTPYRDHNGRVIAALCVSRNVTAKHDSQEATRLNEERLAKAAKAAGMGIWDIDLCTDRVHCNDLWYDVTGIPRADTITSMKEFMRYVHEDDVGRILADWKAREAAFDQQDEYRAEFRVIDSAGQVRHVQATAAIIRDLADHPIRAIGFVARMPSATG